MALSISSALVLLASTVPGSGEGERAEARARFEQTVRPFLDRTCYPCHGSTRKNRTDLNLDAYPTPEAVAESLHLWERVLRKLETGAMPPEERPRPDPGELQQVVAWIAAEVDRADALAAPDPGRVTARRLNRTEYDNTVRDLLGVELGAAEDFPQDDAGYGFDNIGDVLSLSPMLMEKYLAAAERIARRALFGVEKAKPTLVRLHARTAEIEPTTEPLHDYDETGLSLPGAFHVRHRFPADGEYLFRFILGGSHPLGSDPLEIGLWIDGELAVEGSVDPDADPYAVVDQGVYGHAVELRARVTAGEHRVAGTRLRLYEGLPARYGGPNPTARPPWEPVFRPPNDPTPRQYERWRQRFVRERARLPPVNRAHVTRLELAGPYGVEPGPDPASLGKVYVCGHGRGGHGPGCAREIVSSLARRAFRRPVAEDEVERLLELYSLARGEGDSFAEGIAVALQAILIAPDFLFRIEREPPGLAPGAAYAVSPHELASRLSYFLWASAPDEELLGLADRGTLGEPQVLAAQVRRMLRDPRSRSLATSFASQWLHVRGLADAAPDEDRFPEFDDNLRFSMERETELFFEELVREDRSVLELLDGRYTYLNDRLARHYGIPGVEGPRLRRVALAEGSARAGVITHGSVLTVTSYATRTSPVLRGKWILENILNAPPPEPPPDVPNLDEAAIDSAASLREQLEAHRADPTCSSCHSRMDPLGFGLENFDAVGAWRRGDGRSPIDASGTLPDGRSFEGPEGLREVLAAERDAFAGAIVEKLLTYALGRGLERYDRPAVKAIAARLAENGYRFSELVLGIVESPPFRMRRAGGET